MFRELRNMAVSRSYLVRESLCVLQAVEPPAKHTNTIIEIASYLVNQEEVLD
jgi:hypothetical protein